MQGTTRLDHLVVVCLEATDTIVLRLMCSFLCARREGLCDFSRHIEAYLVVPASLNISPESERRDKAGKCTCV
jgi:hypothetical protein